MERKEIGQIIRVNQAGEFGATRIYAGQLAILGSNKKIKHMAEQEAQHLKDFNRLLIENRVRPTLLQPLWHIAGYGLGMVTALFGEKAAHACTVAVETVIDDHYQQQLEKLESLPEHETLRETIRYCREEELEHKQIAEEEAGGDVALAYPILSATVQTISKVAIWLSSRI